MLFGLGAYFSESTKGYWSMRKHFNPPEPVHVSGIHKGEEHVLNKGREQGCGGAGAYRSARDSTSINPDSHGPIDPAIDFSAVSTK